MAGISSTRTRADLKFIAEDIGRELIPFLPTEDRLAGLSAEDRVADLSAEDRLIGINPEEIFELIDYEKVLNKISPERRKQLVEALAKLQSADSLNQEKQPASNGN